MESNANDAAVIGFYIGLIVAAAIQGIMAGHIWDGKGGSALVGVLAGFFLGPIGLLWVGFDRPGKRRCEACEQRVPDAALKCWACATLLDDESEEL